MLTATSGEISERSLKPATYRLKALRWLSYSAVSSKKRARKRLFVNSINSGTLAL